MTQHYIGVKQVVAWTEEKDGIPGYAVKYPDGDIRWSPKEVFEASYLPMGEDNDGSKISLPMVQSFGTSGEVTRMGNHTVLMANHRNGFTIIGESACVDPANYNEEIGVQLAAGKCAKQLWNHLGFVLSWARNGLTPVTPGIRIKSAAESLAENAGVPS